MDREGQISEEIFSVYSTDSSNLDQLSQESVSGALTESSILDQKSLSDVTVEYFKELEEREEHYRNLYEQTIQHCKTVSRIEERNSKKCVEMRKKINFMQRLFDRAECRNKEIEKELEEMSDMFSKTISYQKLSINDPVQIKEELSDNRVSHTSLEWDGFYHGKTEVNKKQDQNIHEVEKKEENLSISKKNNVEEPPYSEKGFQHRERNDEYLENLNEDNKLDVKSEENTIQYCTPIIEDKSNDNVIVTINVAAPEGFLEARFNESTMLGLKTSFPAISETELKILLQNTLLGIIKELGEEDRPDVTVDGYFIESFDSIRSQPSTDDSQSHSDNTDTFPSSPILHINTSSYQKQKQLESEHLYRPYTEALTEIQSKRSININDSQTAFMPSIPENIAFKMKEKLGISPPSRYSSDISMFNKSESKGELNSTLLKPKQALKMTKSLFCLTKMGRRCSDIYEFLPEILAQYSSDEVSSDINPLADPVSEHLLTESLQSNSKKFSTRNSSFNEADIMRLSSTSWHGFPTNSVHSDGTPHETRSNHHYNNRAHSDYYSPSLLMQREFARIKSRERKEFDIPDFFSEAEIAIGIHKKDSYWSKEGLAVKQNSSTKKDSSLYSKSSDDIRVSSGNVGYKAERFNQKRLKELLREKEELKEKLRETENDFKCFVRQRNTEDMILFQELDNLKTQSDVYNKKKRFMTTRKQSKIDAMQTSFEALESILKKKANYSKSFA